MSGLAGILLALQAAWVAAPARPTVGDTIWIARVIATPPGWRLRPGRLELGDAVTPLGDPAVARVPEGWVVRYPVAIWRPGPTRLVLPPVWRLGPDGRADSLAGAEATVTVVSVIPDTLRAPEPRSLLPPLRPERRRPLPPLAAALAAAALLGAGVAWRRRPPRPPRPPRPGEDGVHPPVEPEVPGVPDARWLAAGEPKAVAVRARWRLRAAVARAVPEAHLALATAECVATVARVRPEAPVRELRDLLEQLDRVAFASAHGTDVAALAAMARRLARELAP
jgi:hypothetical protein